VYAFLILTFALLFAACRPAAAPVSISNSSKSQGVVPQTNLPLPVIKNVERLGWDTFDGRPERLGDFQGKAVVLDFWATFCPPCLEEIPHLVELQKRHEGSLQIVGLHVGGAEDRPKVPAFVEKLQINYTLAYPQDALTEGLMGSESAIPQTFVFDKNGKLIKRFVGYNAEIRAELDRAVQDAIK
jgi:cytochrome c biogenesis protein CcmG/thiol:disulfide interchange protein DsbE